jgi:nucleoside-diphosphate-sugar epimerase
MKISILGGGGFLGRKIAERLAREGTYAGQKIARLTLFDIAAPPAPDASFPVTALAGDVVELPESAIPVGTAVVFHLAAVVSAQAETDDGRGGGQAASGSLHQLSRQFHRHASRYAIR